MARKNFRQFHIEDEILRRIDSPALDEAWLRHRIKSRVHFDHIEMLRVPGKPFAGGHPLRIPALDKTRVRPAGCANEDFGRWFLNCFLRHSTRGTTTAKKSKPRRQEVVAGARFELATPRSRDYEPARDK